MRRIAAPLITALGTAILIAAAATVPTLAGPPAAQTTPTQCVAALHPPPGTAGAFGISAGPRGVWYSHGSTVDHVTANGIEEIPLPDPATANAGTLAWKPGGPLWFADHGNSRIGSIDQHGVVRTYDVPHPTAPIAVPQGIVIGPRPRTSGSPIKLAAASTGSTPSPDTSTFTPSPRRTAHRWA